VVPPGRHEVRFSFHPLSGALAQISNALGVRGDGANRHASRM
jgi:hypothetical protein